MLSLYLVTALCWMAITAQGLIEQSGKLRPYNEITDVIKNHPTYMVVASKVVRPGQVYKVMATIFKTALSVNVRASVQRDGVEIASATQECKADISETLLLKISSTSVFGNYKLRIEGNVHGRLGGAAFYNESALQFHQQSMTIFIQTDRPIYMQGQTVRFRAVPITTDLKAFPDTVDVFMLNPQRAVVRRWLSRQTNFGAVTLDYPLSEQPVFGNWTIQVIAQGQVEESSFLVEEYYQTQYEINVTAPAFVVDTDEYIIGSVMANYTSGIPVPGNLSIVASIEPLEPHYKIYGSTPTVHQYLEIFDGYMDFKISLRELERIAPQLDKSKVRIAAYVGERYLNMIESGFAETLIFSSYTKLKFLGSSPQIFKPQMPFTVYLAVSNHDGTPLSERRLQSHRLTVTPTVHMRGGRIRKLNAREETPTKGFDGIWEIQIELEELRDQDANDIEYMTLNAYYTDESFADARAQLKVYASYSKSQIQITTSTKEPKVGEYIIFHVRCNYFMEGFSYIILSKGIILLTGSEKMTSKLKTFAVALSPEMAPTTTVVVYNIGRNGEIVADSLTFPVDGISRNNFEIELNNRKDKTGDTIEVVIRGRPGSYVGLSSVDKTLYDMQTGNELSYTTVVEKMGNFDIGVNGTHSFIWYSKEGKPIHIVNFPASTYGIDANRTFEFAQLLVFTDANVTKVPDDCNITAGYAACLDGTCYPVQKHCDKYDDCTDGSDESGCTSDVDIHYSHFRMHRLNRIQRLYDNAWLWRNINIGPLGHSIFSIPVPQLPVQWVVTAFGVNNIEGFGVLKTPLEFSSVKPFYMNVEMPSECKHGEQIGIRISIFNYLVVEIEVLVILENSNDYKFVHVEPFGMVKSYNPRTSFGEHQHLVFIKPGKTTVVYMPIVPTRLGSINVTITTKTQVAKQSVTKMLHVLADGVVQYKHSSVSLDLSEGAYLIKYLDTNITEVPIVPLQYDRLYVFGSNQAAVSVVGDIMGPVFPTIPVNASTLLHKPSRCGEQNMFDFAANLYMLVYLRDTAQRNFAIEKQAFHHLNKGYQQQLTYQAEDGSFFPFRWFGEEPSVWLTAFCIKTLHKATFQEWENFLYIDPNVISRAVKWIVKHQTPEGSFYETSLYPLDRKMSPHPSRYQDVGVKLRNVSLTAHVLIALEEVKHMQEVANINIAEARQKAIKYLENNLHMIKDLVDPYQLAISTYALTVAKSAEGTVAFNALDRRKRDMSGTTYWGKEKVPPIKVVQENNRPYIEPRLPNKYDASNVETTAYALLSYVERNGVFQDSIVEWLNTQRLSDGGWASTQDTVLALEALGRYAQKVFVRGVTNLHVIVEVPSSPGFNKEVHFKEYLYKMQRFEIPNAWGPVIVKAQGAGIGIVQMSTQYNVERPYLLVPPPVESFSLNIRTYLAGRNSSHIKYDCCQRWTLLDESPVSGMAVLEVDIPTGYIIQQQSLDRLINSSTIQNLREARFSERKVSIYFNYLESRPTCLTFTVQRWYPVANMTRYISARVYDYYAPERFNETILDMYSLHVINICEVCGSYQCPYCPIFGWSPYLRSSPVLTVLCLFVVYATYLCKQ